MVVVVVNETSSQVWPGSVVVGETVLDVVVVVGETVLDLVVVVNETSSQV